MNDVMWEEYIPPPKKTMIREILWNMMALILGTAATIFLAINGFDKIKYKASLEIISIKDTTALPFNNTALNTEYPGNEPFGNTTQITYSGSNPYITTRKYRDINNTDPFKHRNPSIQSINIPSNYEWPSQGKKY